MAAPVLKPGQFHLGGVTWGTDSVDSGIVVNHGEDGWDRGEWSVDVQDAVRPGRDGIAFGRDTAKPPVWTWSLTAHADTVQESMALARKLAGVWASARWRAEPGAMATLYYNEYGVTRFVRGRPRKIAVTNPKRYEAPYHRITASFQLADALSFEAAERSMNFDLVTTTTAESIRLPWMLPVRLGTISNTREGFVTLDSAASGVPVKLTIRGPITGVASGIKLKATPINGGHATWQIDLSGVSVRPNETVVVDTATGIVTRNGVPFTVGIGARTALRARLFAGQTELSYEASDPSLTSTATLSWSQGDPI